MIYCTKKQPERIEDVPVGEDETELPPLDGDDLDESAESDKVQYLDLIGEGDAPLPGDGDGSVEEESASPMEDAFESEAVSWIEGESEDSEVDMDVEIDNDEKEWAEESGAADGQTEQDGDWFSSEYDSETEKNDDEAEGAIEDESIELDQKRWEDMKEIEEGDDEAEQFPDSPIDRICEEIEKNPEEDADAQDEAGAGLILESHFLGPLEEEVVGVVMIDGIPVAAGDDLFVIGADGMFHGVQISETIFSLAITSVCAHAGAIFVGTEKGGALVTRDLGSTFEPINGWYTIGLIGSKKGSERRMSVDFHVAGQLTAEGYRLFGLTGEGQLFFSLDRGNTWMGPLTDGHCLAAAPSQGAYDLFAFVRFNEQFKLLKSRDLSSWEEVGIPPRLMDLVSRCSVRISACADTIAIAADDPAAPLFCSLDKGMSWIEIDAVRGATAIALDPENPGCIAAALYQAESDVGVVKITEDGGATWQTVLVSGKFEEMPSFEAGRDIPKAKVCCLVIDSSRKRQMMAVTPGGVYRVVLARSVISH